MLILSHVFVSLLQSQIIAFAVPCRSFTPSLWTERSLNKSQNRQFTIITMYQVTFNPNSSRRTSLHWGRWLTGINTPQYFVRAVSYAETRPPVIWTGKTNCGRMGYLSGQANLKKKNYSYVSWSPVRRTAQSALDVMLLSYYIGMCVFHDRQCDICRRRTYSQGFAKAVHMSYDRQHFDPA